MEPTAIWGAPPGWVGSVAYPQQNRETGDGVREAEAALLWVKHEASRALGVTVGRIFQAGHSQGGYVVTRLNTMHQGLSTRVP